MSHHLRILSHERVLIFTMLSMRKLSYVVCHEYVNMENSIVYFIALIKQRFRHWIMNKKLLNHLILQRRNF